MEAHRGVYRVVVMARVLEVSCSGYYAWRKRPPSRRSRANEALLQDIRRVFKASRGTYGSPRVSMALKAEGTACGMSRVARLMRANGIRAERKRRFKATTDSGHAYPVAENLLQQNFTADRPNRVWVSDITYLSTPTGWQYLALVKDLYHKKAVGWAVSDRLKSDLVIRALEMACLQRQPEAGLILHSDRGVQYASDAFRHLLNKHGIVQSMSGKGNCYDNAVAESMFATLKREIVNFGRFGTLEETRSLIFEYLELFYNRKRRHSALGYLTPDEFEKQINIR